MSIAFCSTYDIMKKERGSNAMALESANMDVQVELLETKGVILDKTAFDGQLWDF